MEINIGRDVMFDNKFKEPEQLPALALAYIGDAVYELYVRTKLVNDGVLKVNELHREATKYVRASSQARVMEVLNEQLTDLEDGVMRRGRNAKSGTSPKNADIIDYRKSTGFEALVGYLYLKGENERLKELLAIAIENTK